MENNKGVTAVEWLVEQLFKKSDIQYINGFDGLIEQAITLEKEQIIDSFEDGHTAIINSEQYYNKTFNK